MHNAQIKKKNCLLTLFIMWPLSSRATLKLPERAASLAEQSESCEDMNADVSSSSTINRGKRRGIVMDFYIHFTPSGTMIWKKKAPPFRLPVRPAEVAARPRRLFARGSARFLCRFLISCRSRLYEKLSATRGLLFQFFYFHRYRTNSSRRIRVHF